MHVLAAASGFALLVVILVDTFESLILPRQVTRRFRLARGFYRVAWRLCSAVAGRWSAGSSREAFISAFGPLSLLVLLVVWAQGLVLAFALIGWGMGASLSAPEGHADFRTYLYLSGVMFSTLGLGDITPGDGLSRTLAVVEAGVGFGFLAVVISYLPVLYQAFSRREATISLLDARAGSPPSATELLRRHAQSAEGATATTQELGLLLREWERWASELLESHLSYPVLVYYRSQHDRESWLAALTTILDTCALVIAGIPEGPVWQARLTLAMARHAVVDLALVFDTPPRPPIPERLPPDDLSRLRAALRAAGIPLDETTALSARLSDLRGLYEPYVNALAHHLLVALPPWIPSAEDEVGLDNWQRTAWGHSDHF